VPFKKRAVQPPVPASPEALYPVLAHGPGAPQELWSRQADVLRAYHARQPVPADVAIELPTGAGKTLVGCLIADWRRRKYGHRVAYVAPTRQLAQQAAARGKLYGIPVVDLTGPHTGWNLAAEATFNQGDAVAFITYSAIFNVNPHIDAQTLVLDDAHAAEGPVASNWSVRVRRTDPAFPAVLEALARAGAVSADLYRRLWLDVPEDHADGGTGGAGTVYLAGIAETAAAAADLEHVLQDAADRDHLARDAAFALGMITGSLPACLAYVSYREILIRPLIAPTRYHQAFAAAEHRVYMSATLGDGGELERAFGKRKIDRVPVPAGWETQGTGRRFFIFPDMLKGIGNEEQAAAFSSGVITEFGKAVLIAPSKRARDRAVGSMVPAEITAWEPEAYAGAPDAFSTATTGVLALANRYDGIDLPDGTCRLVLLTGLPVGTHLQEQFLHGSLGAISVLTERIRARVTQGTGRATRNSSDYAAVLMLGRDLATFCAQADVQAASHPELRAEIAFGLRNSRGVQAGDTLENIAHFRDQDEEWREAEQDIITSREESQRTRPAGTDKLAASAEHEVAAVNAAWQGDWPRAVDEAGKAAAALAGGPEIRRYQALWHYILASWAVIATREDQQDRRALADVHFADARAAATGTRWLAELTTSADKLLAAQPQDTANPVDTAVIAGIASSPLRTAPDKAFTNLVKSVRDGLAKADAKPFEHALAVLGQLAGATVPARTGADAEPDSVWMFGAELWVALEAKTESNPDGAVCATDARQAGGHLNYTVASTKTPVPPGSFMVIISPQTTVDPAAAKVAGQRVYLAAPAVLSDIGARLTDAWQSIRVQTRNLEPDQAAPAISGILRAARALPTQWLPELTARRVADG
jgi:hypothetical protein